jgi:hypothetical protein
MSRRLLVFSGACLLTASVAAAAHEARQSILWPPKPTQSPGSDLPDFSWAGYRAGETPANAKVTSSVRDFGVRGDGQSDDTVAFQRALDSAPAGVILVPRGRYRLDSRLTIARSDLVLRGAGAGPDGTMLQFGSSLADQQGIRELPETNKLSWSGGLIQVVAKGSSERRVAEVTAEARRGGRRLVLSNTNGVRRGDILFLRLSEDDGRSLERHLIGEPDAANASSEIPKSTCAARMLDWTFQVANVEGNEVVFSQPLRTDVRKSWTPTVWRMPIVREVGIEHLAIGFPCTPYPGHHRERGFNAIDFSQNVLNAWVSDVTVHNADSGVFVGRRSKWITISGLRLVSTRPPDAKGMQGHHGIALSGCSDVLVTNLDFEAEFIHEMTVTHRAMGNVFSGPVTGKTIDLDHHRDAPFENLFQNMSGDLHLQDGGSACYGPPMGTRNTYWGLAPFTLPPWLGNQSMVVGRLSGKVIERRGPEVWIESVPDLVPNDLRSAQRQHRLTAPVRHP